MAKTRNELEHAVHAVLRCCNLRCEHQRFVGDYDSYGSKIVPDFVVYAEAWGASKFLIECRQQLTPGSADQKTHAIVARARSANSLPTIIVFCGPYAEGKTYEFAKDNLGGQFKAAVTFGEFIGLVKEIAKNGGGAPAARSITANNPDQKTIWSEYAL